MSAHAHSSPWTAGIACCGALLGAAPCFAAQAPVSTSALTPTPGGEFIYHARAHDTLIGLGRRLLLQPRLWPVLQSLNHIADPRRIPQGTVLRIPYEMLRTSAETATVAGLGGNVSQSGTAVTVGQQLPQGSVIETGPDGSVTINLADGSSITLHKSSVLKLDQMKRIDGVDAAHSIQLQLDSGRVDAGVKPHRDVGRFEIVTPVAVSAVRGTQFRDGFDAGTAHATTETLDGSVDVASAAIAAPVSVAAGFGTRVEQGRAPLPPVVLLAPPDLSKVPAVLSDSQARIAWPPVAGASSYRLQASDAPDFHVLAVDIMTTGPAAELPALAEGIHWLRVRSIDALGLEGRDALTEVTRHLLPDAPVPGDPADGARISGTTARFSWTYAGPPAHFHLQVAVDRGFAAPMLENDDLAALELNCCELPAGSYFWRVAAVNDRGESGPWSDVRGYVRLPEAPLPDIPRVEGKTLLLAWTAIQGQVYRIEIARDAAFRDIVRARRSDDATLTIPKLFPGEYFLRVQLVDADDHAGQFGPARRFTVPVPLWVKILAPTALLLPLIL